MARNRSLRSFVMAVPPHAQGSRTQLVRDNRTARATHARDYGRLQSRAASDVFGILAVGAGAVAAAAQLDRWTCRHCRIWDIVLYARWPGRTVDERNFRRRIPSLHGAYGT